MLPPTNEKQKVDKDSPAAEHQVPRHVDAGDKLDRLQQGVLIGLELRIYVSDHFLFQPTRGILEKRTQLTVCVKMFDHCSYKLTQTVLERPVKWLSLNDKRTETYILRQMSSQRGHCQDDGLQAR